MRRGPLKGAVSAQKARQVSATETKELPGGTKDKVSPVMGVIDLPSRRINDLKKETEKN